MMVLSLEVMDDGLGCQAMHHAPLHHPPTTKSPLVFIHALMEIGGIDGEYMVQY